MQRPFALLSALVAPAAFGLPPNERPPTTAVASSACVSPPFKPFVHVAITQAALQDASLTRTLGNGLQARFTENARDAIASANRLTDFLPWSFLDGSAHFTDEILVEASQRLIDLRQEVVSLVTNTTFRNGLVARRRLGQALHTLQDFYAHSNWVDLGNAGICTPLGRSVLTSTCLGDDRRTVDRRTSTRTIFVPDGRGALVPVSQATLLSDALDDYGLRDVTTGYFNLAGPESWQFIPQGKCWHTTVDFASYDAFGVDKDRPGRRLHEQARDVALAASVDYVGQVLEQLAGDDAAIRALMGVEPLLAFVIDTTGSMGSIIASVRSNVAQLAQRAAASSRPPGGYILQTFNDPFVGAPLVTASVTSFLSALNGVGASGGGDCPELAFTGLRSAIRASDEGGRLFLFTDASPKDPELQPEVTALARDKFIVSAIQFGSCAGGDDEGGQQPSSTDLATGTVDPDFQALAEATGGQALRATLAEIPRLFKLISPFVDGDLRDVLTGEGDLSSGPVDRSFSIESSVRACTVVTTSTSLNTTVLRRPDGSVVSAGQPDVSIQPLGSGQVVTLTNPLPGQYTVTIGGGGSFTLAVQANAAIDLRDFAFVEEAGPTGHRGYSPLDSSPLPGAAAVGNADLRGPAAAARIVFRRADGSEIARYDAQRDFQGNSGTDLATALLVPNEPFRTYVEGTDLADQPFQRVAPGLFRPAGLQVEVAEDRYWLRPDFDETLTFQVRNLGAPAVFEANLRLPPGATGVSVQPASAAIATDGTQDFVVAFRLPGAAFALRTEVELRFGVFDQADTAVTKELVLQRLVVGDQDGDGQPDPMEMGPRGRASPTYDGNRDGTPDWQQANVTSLPSTVSNAYATIAVASPLQLRDVRSEPIPPQPPAEFTLVDALWSFRIEGVPAAGKALVVIANELNGGTLGAPDLVVSLGPTPSQPTPTLSVFRARTEPGDTPALRLQPGLVVVELQNGANGDIDVNANDSAITFNGGLAVTQPAAPAGKKSSWCFIATAAYGDANHPDVTALRTFRDEILLPSRLGTALVETYYAYSPPLAEWLAVRPTCASIVRVALAPVVAWARLTTAHPLLGGLTLLGSIWLLVRLLRRGLRAMAVRLRAFRNRGAYRSLSL